MVEAAWTRLDEAPTGAFYTLLAVLLFMLTVVVPVFISSADLMDFRVHFFQRYTQPEWRPPSWVFGVVGTLMYLTVWWSSVLFFTSGLLVDSTTGVIAEVQSKSTRTIYLWGVWLFVGFQVLNLMWTPLFFGYQQFALSLLVGLLMTAVTVAASVLFWHVNITAGALLIPMAAWLLFHCILTGYYVATIGWRGPSTAEGTVPASSRMPKRTR